MLGCSYGTSSSSQEEEDHRYRSAAAAQTQHHQQPTFTTTAIHTRQLLISCAELIISSTRPGGGGGSDPSAAHRLLTLLFTISNPFGDSTERLAHHFTKALSFRLNINPVVVADAAVTTSNSLVGASATTAAFFTALVPPPTNNLSDEALVQSAYLSLNQVTPFIRFCQLTANQAILDAIVTEPAIHILDFNIMHGLQWPPFMQAIVDRYPSPSLRITGTGHDLDTLRRTGDRLAKFAHSLGLRFQFHPLLVLNEDDLITALGGVLHFPGETLAINSVLYLHRLLKDREKIRVFLHKIKSMNPKVVTLGEREGNHNHPVFMQRFVEALDHYAAVFDSLEATLPPNSRERQKVEEIWFGREIIDIVAGDHQGNRRERHERFRAWEVMLRSSGFSNVPLSSFALAQAKLLLRLHYPSEGYQLHILHNSLFLGWQNQPLFSVSSWH